MWRVGLVQAPLIDVLTSQGQVRHPVTWCDEIGDLRFLADPFGLWRDGKLHVFVETYDYRDRVGAIDVMIFDESLRLLERRGALREPWHLSYPFIVEEDGETYMLPEAHKSGKLTLYRAAAFPDRWEPAHVMDGLDAVPIDATPVFHDGLWWLFYTPATTKADKVSALHVAFSKTLAGPWTPHPGNPVLYDPSSARPGGTPIVRDGVVILPVQDCRETYGGAIRALHVTTLTPDRFEAHADEPIRAPRGFGRHVKGLHTASAAGGVTLIDAKRFELSPRSVWLDAKRAWRKHARRR